MIRPFLPADEDAVIRVWLAATITGQQFLPEEFWRSEEAVVRGELLPIAETWVVEEDGEIVAFVSLLDDLIGGLFTQPDQQGKGYGSALIERVRQRHEVVWVEVFRRNERAIAFYEAQGFAEERAEHHDETGLEAVIMRIDGTSETPAPS